MLITDPSITEIFKEATDDFMEQTGPTNGTRKARLRHLVGNYVNGRSARGGVALDGSSNTRVYSTLTSQGIGTDSFSLSTVLRVPTTNPATAAGILALSASSTDATAAASAFQVLLQSNGSLRIQSINAAATGGIFSDVIGFQSAWSGKVVSLVVTRSGTTVSLYINGVAQTVPAGTTYGTSPGDFANTVTSTYLLVGFNYSTYVWNGPIYTASLYNLALTQADVTEIYELGGAVPERFKFGSQGAANVSTMVNGIAGNNLYGTFSGASATGLSAADTTGFHGASAADTLSISAGQRVRVKATLTLNSGTAPTVGIFTPGVAGMSTGDSVLSAGANVIELTATQLNSAARISFYRSGATDFVLSAVAVQRLGAVVHLDGDSDGLGYQWHDYSTNKLDAMLTTTGASFTKAARMGYLRALSDGTTTPQQLTGATSLPANCQLLRIRARSLTGTPSIILGSSSGGSQYVASVALTTAWKNLTIALTDGLVTANSALWLTASAANVVEVQTAYETLT